MESNNMNCNHSTGAGGATENITRPRKSTIHVKATAEDETTPSRSTPADSLDSIGSLDSRQYFKIHVAPKKALKQNGQTLRRSIVNQDQESGVGAGTALSSGKQKISNATLKKLLNQSMLLKSMNSPSNSTQANQNQLATSSAIGAGSKPSFKFVFIQRATAAPNSNSLNKQTPKTSSVSATQSSLAASVSKQLANSLLNSAANLVDNLQASSKPSLSALANQISLNGRNSTTTTTTSPAITKSITDSQSATETTSRVTEQSSTSDSDIKRVQSEKRKHTPLGSGNKKNKQSGSKIYNLPVKFVSNGQPNNVVLTTLRHHFGTIKKLQAVANMAATLAVDQNKVASIKRRKQGMTKLKGNSRFIYLPLKYLSNARPNKINISRATHKSAINNLKYNN